MSLEQWVLAALVLLVPLLEGLARLRRSRVNGGAPGNRDVQAPPLPRQAPRQPRAAGDRAAPVAAISPPPPLPVPVVSEPARARARLPASHERSSRRSRPDDARRRDQEPPPREAVAQWLRPARNLRRAIVIATILGPPPQ